MSTNDKSTLAIEAINTNFIFQPSTSSQLEIKAYHEGVTQDNSSEWDLRLEQDANYIKLLSAIRPKQQITSQVFISGDVSNAQFVDILKQSLTPILQDLQDNPIPDVLQTELNQLNFDFEAYNKIGEAYLKIWEQAFVDHLDEKGSKQVKQWSQETVPNLIRVSKQNDQNISRNNAELSNLNKGYQVYISKSITSSPEILNSNEYTIEIGVPENVSIRLNTRHGSFIAKSALKNVKGTLKYTPFEAREISGDSDLVIDFAAVKIDRWKEGKLSIGYSKNAKIVQANQIDLHINSSKVQIGELVGTGIFNSAFSKLNIIKTSTDFNNLVFLLTQSDLILQLPSTSYNFAYSGSLSLIEFPKEKLRLTSLGDFQSHMLHGYAVDRNTPKELQINAKYSQVFLK